MSVIVPGVKVSREPNPLLLGDAVAEGDELGPALDAAHLGAFAQQRAHREGQVALAAAHVDHRERPVGRERGLGEEVGEQLGELLDLAELVRHALAGLAAVVGHAEGAEPRGLGGEEVGLGAVVTGHRRGGRAGRRGFFHAQAGGAVGLAFQLRGRLRGEQVGVQEVRADQRLQQGEGGGGRVVLGHVAGGVPPDQGQVRTGLQRDGPDEEVFQGGIGPAVLAEGELHEGAVLHGGAEQAQEPGAVVGGRVHLRGGSPGTWRGGR